MSAILRPDQANVRCQCTVDLIGRALGSINRPNYRFLVNVWGYPPHAVSRRYEIVAYGEDTAAHLAIQRFTREVSLPLAIAALV